ncbi:trypsin-like peptidase domain-containing protein [Pseudohaliea sp.]|uniref:trypsin-like serine peptidase n=1 Tax=Pseudohaliea sp. TaxID=2740289 RepID=UPI0032ED8F36
MVQRLARRLLLALVSIVAMVPALADHGAGAAERRLPVADDAPPWLLAVGRLAIPTSRLEAGRRRHYDERCSGTLLAPPDGGDAQFVLSAWHCLEYYTDLSRAIRFELTGLAGEVLESRARAVASGGGMAADWALLELNPPIPAGLGGTAELDGRTVAAGARLAMAGFSGDPGLGAGGAQLTYDPACRVTGTSGADRLTDCLAYKGASGGGAFHGGRLVGVLSRGDSRGRSIYVPAARFLPAVSRRLR